MTVPANVAAYHAALASLAERIAKEKDADCLRVLLEAQQKLLAALDDLPFSQVGSSYG